MIGNNKMELNHATLNEAVTHWLNATQFQGRAAVEVTSIRYLTPGHGSFKVEFRPIDREGDTNDS